MRHTYAKIDLGALCYNMKKVRELVGPGTRIMGIVKADGYGHGMVAVSRALCAGGVDMLGVAFAFEGISLREAGIKVPVVVLGGIEKSDLSEILRFGLTPAVTTLEVLEELERKASSKNMSVGIHLNVDTGMTRLGVPFDTAGDFLNRVISKKQVRLDGLMTHFAESEASDSEYSLSQLKLFADLTCTAQRLVPSRALTNHCANSAAIVNLPASHFQAVRPGIMLYGYFPSRHLEKKTGLKRVLSWHTRIVSIRKVKKGTSIGYSRSYIANKDMTIAILPVGYGDGYARRHNSPVLIQGARRPVLGRISMDAMVVDISGLPGVGIGEPVCLLGKDGELEISAYELAGSLGSIPYEVLTSISSRVPRRYV